MKLEIGFYLSYNMGHGSPKHTSGVYGDTLPMFMVKDCSTARVQGTSKNSTSGTNRTCSVNLLLQSSIHNIALDSAADLEGVRRFCPCVTVHKPIAIVQESSVSCSLLFGILKRLLCSGTRGQLEPL